MDVDADAISLAPIPSGKFNDSYYVLAGGTEYVLRIAPSRNAVFCFYEREMMRQEPFIHQMLLPMQTVPWPTYTCLTTTTASCRVIFSSWNACPVSP